MIERGDLVMVVRGHSCVLAAYGGIPLTVLDIKPRGLGFRCSRCGVSGIWTPEPHAVINSLGHIIPLSWLRKIPPIADLESSETETTA